MKKQIDKIKEWTNDILTNGCMELMNGQMTH